MVFPRLALALLTFVAAPVARAEEPSDATSFEENLVTVNAQNTSLAQVLEMLSVQQRVNIVLAAAATPSVTVNIYDASLEEALDWLLLPHGLDWRFDGRVYYVQESESFLAEELPPLDTRIFRPDYLSAVEAERLVTPMLSGRGRITISAAPEVGIPTGEEETGGVEPVSRETVVVMDDEETLLHIADFLANVDVPPKQVLVEATIIEVKLDENNKFGVDLGLLSNLDFDEADIFSGVSDPRDLFGDPVDGSNGFGGTQGFADPTADGLQVAFIKDNFAIFLEALNTITDTEVLANTKVLALNKMRGEIIIGGRLGYNAGTTVSDGISQQNVEFLEVGTQLRFRPFIGRDGWVRLEIHPERSSGVIDTATGLPTESTSEVTTNVMMQDGTTIIIGGLIETRDVMVEKKVPILGYVPVLEWIFSSEESMVTRSEIIVLITVHVLELGESRGDGNRIIEEKTRDREVFRDEYGPIARVEHGQDFHEMAQQAFDDGDLALARKLCDRALNIDPLATGLIDLSEAIDAAIAEAKANGTWTGGYNGPEVDYP